MPFLSKTHFQQLEKLGLSRADQFTYNTLKFDAKMYLQGLLGEGNGKKIALLLVDVQNGFTRKSYVANGKTEKGMLYVSGGESTILTNMALLEALLDLTKTQREQFEIVTTQDAHREHREQSPMGQKEIATLRKAYPISWQRIVDGETKELSEANPAEGQFGLHCVVGLPDADIAEPVEQLLQAAEKIGIAVTRFGKINFDGSAAGMKLNPGKLSGMGAKNIYAADERGQPIRLTAHMQQYGKVVAAGICGDVCVKQTVEGLRENFITKPIVVLGDFSHYLTIPGVDTVETTKSSYRGKSIEYKIFNKQASNDFNWESNLSEFLDAFAAANRVTAVGEPRLFSQAAEQGDGTSQSAAPTQLEKKAKI